MTLPPRPKGAALWPVEAPRFGAGMPPVVHDVPEALTARLEADVVSRYHRTLASFGPEAMAFALSRPPVEELDDTRFVSLLTDTLYAHFLCPTLDPADMQAFGPDLTVGPVVKVDLSPLSEIEPIEGVYFVPSITLLERLPGPWSFRVRAIRLGGAVLTPADTPAWALARLFVLQGVAQATITGVHPLLHFPMDALIAVSMVVLPAEHPARRVVEAHADYTLALSYRVLEHPRTILRGNPDDPYTCFPLPEAGCRQLIHRAYAGVAGNSAWPSWRWPAGPRRTGAPFYETEGAYYDLIRGYLSEVFATLPEEDPALAAWAGHLSMMLPGFPGPEAIRSRLTDVLALFVTDVSVMHSADHQDLVRIPVGLRPFRLRVPPPRDPKASAYRPRDLISRQDVVRTCFADEMYFRPWAVTHLRDVDYGFTDPELRDLNRSFLRELEAVSRRLGERASIPLDKIARSIQF